MNIFKRTLNKNQRKGIYSGLIAPYFYSLDSILDIILFAVIFSATYRSGLDITTVFVYSVITSIFKDVGLFFYVAIKKNKTIFKDIKTLYKNKPKAFWLVFMGSISGGPLGFSLTTATILYNGAAYGSALSNFSPIVVLFLSRMFLKTKISKIGWIGVITTIIGFIGLSISKSINIDGSFQFNGKVFIGIVLAILAVLTWSVETFIAEYVEKLDEQALNTDEKLLIKSIVSSPFLIIILLPIGFLLTYIFKEHENAITMLKTIFNDWRGWFILLLIGFVVTIGRILYWRAIEYAGGGRADILYYLTVLIVPLFSLILYLLKFKGFENPSGIFEYRYWFFITIQVIGIVIIILTTENHKKNSEKKNKNVS